MLEAVIFDKDGVLVLTEEVYFRAFRDTVKKFGGEPEFKWDDHYYYIGVPTSETFFAVREKYGLRVNLDTFVEEYRREYRRIFEEEGLSATDGVEEFLTLLKQEKIKYAVGTGGARQSTELTLKKAGIYDYFNVIITADDVARGKPDPETFFLAAKGLGADPRGCVVIGGSINDVLAAKSAGMSVIAITDKSYIKDPSLASPDLEVKAFKEITVEMVKSLCE